MSYSDSSFDQSVLKFDVKSKKWIAIEEHSKLFPLLMSYIPSHIVDGSGSTESFTAQVLPAVIKEKDMVGSKIHGRISLNTGFGQYSFYGFDGEKYEAVYQKIGDVVGTNCGAAIMKNLVVFTSGPIEQLSNFLSTLINMTEKTSEGVFTCFVWHIEHQYWRTEAKVTSRPMSSVVLPTSTKSRLIKDLEKFFSPKTMDFYNRNGIPYRRSYLFYGLPGTGKTSMVQALAGHFHRSVCYLMPTHPQMTDDSLREAVNQIPDDSIVVFEDIDSLFAKDRANKVAKSSLTFSGLLNALDGIGNTNGQVYVLTTNLRDQLDSALIRNGRVDMHVEFTYAVEEQMVQMFSNFYPESTHLSAQFASAVLEKLRERDLQVTTAGLQHFFVAQMDATAEEALSSVHTIIEEIITHQAQDKEDAEAAAALEAKELKEAAEAAAVEQSAGEKEGVVETKEKETDVVPEACE